MAFPHPDSNNRPTYWLQQRDANPCRLALVLLLSAALAACQTDAPQTAPAAPPDHRQDAPADAQSARAAAALEKLRAAEASVSALQSQGRIAEAVAALANIAVPQHRRQAINDQLWRLTAEASPARAAALAEQGPAAEIWALRSAIAQSFSAAEKAERLDDWLNRHPRHSLATALPEPLARLRHRPPPARRVGLFIPLNGALAAAGKTVRDGFISAYLQDSTAVKPEVRIYDTAAEPMAALLQASRTAGIEFIVGPLSKVALESLIGLNPRVPVLALNYPRTPMDGYPQAPMRGYPQAPMRGDSCVGEAEARLKAGGGFAALGLAIEDEAALIAERLQADGRERVMVIRNDRNWAIRGTSQLTSSWPHHLEQHAFGNIRTMTESVGEALQVAASQARHDQLAQALGTSLEFLPRARQDIDGIVAFVDHLQARALAPALKFHFAEELPVYASSQSVRGARRLGDLEGFQVAELPFRLHPGPLHQAFSEVFDPQDANLTALFALGIDAYRLLDHWSLLSADDPLRGATGTLRLGDDGCIRRTLGWAVVQGGALSVVP